MHGVRLCAIAVMALIVATSGPCWAQRNLNDQYTGLVQIRTNLRDRMVEITQRANDISDALPRGKRKFCTAAERNAIGQQILQLEADAAQLEREYGSERTNLIKQANGNPIWGPIISAGGIDPASLKFWQQTESALK